MLSLIVLPTFMAFHTMLELYMFVGKFVYSATVLFLQWILHEMFRIQDVSFDHCLLISSSEMKILVYNFLATSVAVISHPITQKLLHVVLECISLVFITWMVVSGAVFLFALTRVVMQYLSNFAKQVYRIFYLLYIYPIAQACAYFHHSTLYLMTSKQIRLTHVESLVTTEYSFLLQKCMQFLKH